MIDKFMFVSIHHFAVAGDKKIKSEEREHANAGRAETLWVIAVPTSFQRLT